MFPQLQGSSPSLQGGSGISLQDTSTIPVVQPAAQAITLQPAAGAEINQQPVSSPAAPTPTPTPIVTAQKQTTTDPYANTVFGSTAGYNKAVANFNNMANSTYNQISDSTAQAARDYNSGMLDYLDQRRQQQNTIDNDSIQNELAREQGMQGILDMVGNGVRSSGVTLANANAGSSSAVDAAARAYGILGRQQATSVGNQFEQGQNKVNVEQNNLGLNDATQLRHSQEDKTRTINSIVNNARQQIAYLNQQAMYSSLPNRVDIESKIGDIKQNALDSLSQYDNVLSQGISNQPAMSQGDVDAKAHNLLVSGTAPVNSFNYTSAIPAEFQNTGPYASSLPIFTAPTKRNDQ